ncbi:MAG: DUF2442 domain-containing protein [Acidobacteriota bacterium]
MQRTANPETDRAFEVAPEISHTVPWRVTSVLVLPDAQLKVTFVDGTSGKVDMRVFLSNSKVDGTVFEPLRDHAVFAEARVFMGAVQWPNGADLAPDAMYDAIRESCVWVLD